MITIKDMAKMVGVSTTTINNVIHGRTGEVSAKTIEKVRKILEEYEYVPNMNARNLAQNKSKIIGIAMKVRKKKYDNAIKDSYVGELVGAIEKSLRTSDYFMMLYISDDINEIIKYVSTWNVDGLLLLGMLGDDSIMIKKKVSKPTVFIDSYFSDDLLEYVNIGLEDEKGTYDITKYLLSCGHRKIGFIADNCIGVDFERFKGYKKALKEYNINFKEEDFMLLSLGEEMNTSLQVIYNSCASHTAFVCASDHYAILVMNYLRDHGKRIPEDISIVGFDDSESSRIVRPALTTVYQNVTHKGEAAVETLLSLIQGDVLETNKVIFPTRLVIRGTVKKLNE